MRALTNQSTNSRRDEARRQALKRKELFWCNKLQSERAAAAVERALHDATTAEVVFLPNNAAARAIAMKTWARDPCKLDAYAKQECLDDVRRLEREGPAPLMHKQASSRLAADKAKRKIAARLGRSTDSTPTPPESPEPPMMMPEIAPRRGESREMPRMG